MSDKDEVYEGMIDGHETYSSRKSDALAIVGSSAAAVAVNTVLATTYHHVRHHVSVPSNPAPTLAEKVGHNLADMGICLAGQVAVGASLVAALYLKRRNSGQAPDGP